MSQKIKFLFNLILFLVLQLSFGQEKEIYASPDVLKSKIVEIRYNMPEKALELAEAFLQYGKDNNDPKIECEAYHQLGKINSIKGDHLNAIIYYDKGIKIAKAINYSEYLIELLVVKGNAFYDLNKNIEAFNQYVEASKLTEASNYDTYRWIIATNLALLKQRNGNFEEATSLFKQSLESANTYPNKDINIQANITSNILLNIGESYLARQLLDSSLYYNRLGLKNSLQNNDLEMSSYFFKVIGEVNYKKGKYNEAIKSLLKAEENAQKLKNELIKAEIYYSLASCYLKVNATVKSISFYLKSIELYEQENSMGPIYQEACIALAKIYNNKDDYENSKIYYEKYIKNSHNLQVQKTILTEKFYQNDIEQLKSDLERYEHKVLAQKKYLIIGSSILFVIVILYLSNRKKLNSISLSRKKKNSKTDQKNIDVDKIDRIINKLTSLEEQKFYLDKDCNLYTLAKSLNTNTSYLSKIINNTKRKTFNNYINDLRIEYAVSKINSDKVFRSYTVKSIAEELGYKSADSFSKYFKSKTGFFPSVFIKKIKSQT